MILAVLLALVVGPIPAHAEPATFQVDLTFLDFTGSPAQSASWGFANLDVEQVYDSADYPVGTRVIRLPKGRYFGFANVSDGTNITIAAEPEFVVSGNITFSVDARDGRPLEFRLDKPNARPHGGELTLQQQAAWGPTGLRNIVHGDFDRFRIRPSRTSSPGFTLSVEANLAEPDDKGGFHNSPYAYHVHWSQTGRVPPQLTKRFRDSEFARVRSVHEATATGKTGIRDEMVSASLPFTLDEYYTPRHQWGGSFRQASGDPDNYDYETSLDLTKKRSFQLGVSVTERWNAPVFGPGFSPGTTFVSERAGDEVEVKAAMFGDHDPNREGSAAYDTGSTVLYRDGVQVGSLDSPGRGLFATPAGTGDFRLVAEQTQTSIGTLATRITSDWRFHSTGDGPLPLLAVRFSPPANISGTATIPFAVQRNGGTASVRSVTVQASYDDGKTWHEAPVRNGTVSVPAPGPGFVSLRTTVTDTDGNTVEQTILRAYRVG
jgi:hypothetical protein